MKKTILILLFISLFLSFAPPAESRRHGGHRHNRHSGWRHQPVFFGTAFISPWYIPVSPPLYIYTQPFVYVPPDQANAYPGSELITKYDKKEESSKEWVTVPGQWVDGIWVPPHTMQIPVNP
jgi:hypothetical protein